MYVMDYYRVCDSLQEPSSGTDSKGVNIRSAVVFSISFQRNWSNCRLVRMCKGFPFFMFFHLVQATLLICNGLFPSARLCPSYVNKNVYM